MTVYNPWLQARKNDDKGYNPKIPLYRLKYGIKPHFSHKKGDDNNKNYLLECAHDGATE